MFPFIFSLCVSFACVYVRSFLYVVVACVGKSCMCAMLKVEDHFWTEFTIGMDDQMHTMFDTR